MHTTMSNVTIGVKSSETIGDRPIILHNGNLVLHFDGNDNCIGAYIVTAFRDYKGVCDNKERAFAIYCSFINIDNGYLAFDERCSRTTTVARVLSHLNPGDFNAEKSIKDGQYIKVYNVGDYKIDLTLLREQM